VEIKVKKDGTISATFGGGGFYKVSPLHPYLFPQTAITDFLNIQPIHINKIIEFTKKYLPFTLFISSTDFKETIKNSFQRVKYELDGIFRKVIKGQDLTYKEIETINKYLTSIHPKFTSYNEKFLRWVDLHTIWTLKSIDSKEQPNIESKIIGHPTEAKNEAKIEITITPSESSKARWIRSPMPEQQREKISKNVVGINPDEYEYKDHKLSFDQQGNVEILFIRLQHQEPKNFKLKELSALMDINSFESFLALQLWRMINDPTLRKTYKVCAGGCGKVHTNKGVYCDSKSCIQKYQAMKRKQRYNSDPIEKERRKQAATKVHKKKRN
jgi:hypothetical protein